jgi:hypothetical protein
MEIPGNIDYHKTRRAGMRSSVPTFLIAGILTLAASAKAGIITISFNELQTGEDVQSYYNGGSGSLGTGPGPSLGVVFDPGWIVSPPDVYDGYHDGKSAVISGEAIVNVLGGWVGAASFYYEGAGLDVEFWDGPDGTGNEVRTLNNLPPEVGFFPVGDNISFFRSVVLIPQGGTDRIDALTFAPFEVVSPEPGTVELSLLAIVGVFSLTAMRRSRHSAGERFGTTTMP